MKVQNESVSLVTPFAKAGFLSRISFWWLNPLLKTGRKKALEDTDIPKLREADRAKNCYHLFLERLNKQRRAEPSILKALILCHWKEIIITGCLALVNVLSLSAGPLLLNSFILVARGKESFKHEGYVIAVSFFILKSIESISQRQLFFRSKLFGLKVRSSLVATIYKKQLRLSNYARSKQSGGEIMNYVTVDAYRIGEFPYWFHQIWATMLQLCISLGVVFKAMGLATIATLVVIILTMICNIPFAKLQQKFQSKLVVAQDERLKTTLEALLNMKILKLHGWETYFKSVIENLRAVELKWLSKVQLRKSYQSILFWSSPLLISSATFGACYFLGVPLHAKISFARIVNFLKEPELHSTRVQHNCNMESVNHSIYIELAKFSWAGNSMEPTITDINLRVRPGEKVPYVEKLGMENQPF